MDNRYAPYTITARRVQTPTVVELVLAPQEGARPAFVPGQFIDVLLPSHGADAKSYTISSAPHEEGFTIAVRRAGPFSQALCGKKEGEELLVSEPYGFFYPVDTKTPRLFLAGGIGITPCISIARARGAGEHAPTVVYYSNRSSADVAYRGALDALAGDDFVVRHFITRERGTDQGVVYERIGQVHLTEALRRHTDAHVFICGSIAFVRDMRLMLKSAGVAEEQLFTEAFF